MFYDGNEHLCILTWGARGTRCICGKIYPTLWMLHIILNVMCTVYNYICRKLQDISSNESNPISVQKMFVPWYWSVVLSVVGHGTISEQVVLQSISGIGLVGGRGSKIILLAKEIQLRHAVHHRMVSNRSSYILSRIVARVWWERLLFLGPNPKIGRKGSKIIRAYDWIVATLMALVALVTLVSLVALIALVTLVALIRDGHADIFADADIRIYAAHILNRHPIRIRMAIPSSDGSGRHGFSNGFRWF